MSNNSLEPVKHNSYFDGLVQSLGVQTDKGKATVGVMRPGKYTFNTGTEEVMVIISGELNVKLPNSDWAIYKSQQDFTIAANQSFDVSCENDVSYICYYA